MNGDLADKSRSPTPVQRATWAKAMGACASMAGPKRRVWRKGRPGIDEEVLGIRTVDITGSQIRDAPVLPNLLCQIQATFYNEEFDR